MNIVHQLAFGLTEHGLLPDVMIRLGIRYFIKQRLREIKIGDAEAIHKLKASFIQDMSRAPIALMTEKPNAQHYEVPAEFFKMVLGPHLKYSSAFWPKGVQTLSDAESAALDHTCAHAQIRDGQHILELGCGWGSLTLWIASHYPHCQVTAVSNSTSQREYIEAQTKARGLFNVHVITDDMNRFHIEPNKFDRVVSVEMFEHMRNWPRLFAHIHDWLKPGGRFFMHIFVHRDIPYLFEDQGSSDWMSRYFFTGGMMPNDTLPLAFQDHLKCIQQWQWDGTHYEKTANAWLANMDAAPDRLWLVLEQTYGKEQAQTWLMRWRIFFMACAELFGYERGDQWWVNHYLFEKPVSVH